ncbi:hypothetical protein [Mucilaginibacter aquatilis]|uniref:Outer membrane protein beta-barrel domain-containing protein n=1 Tax=Mucilaginibacter aquatilis TaxID=1517760 RepID=A0A6I4IAC9_9SPHI|nr:hypothetical protein [Mucilaginibacter aquatilis]MVN92111.1 hypothetical protein [Mucilaginibacter aquatilis]
MFSYSMRLSILFWLLTIWFSSIYTFTFAQARNSIGIGAGLSQPLAHGYKPGRDRILQANFFARNKFSAMTVIGLEGIKKSGGQETNTAFLNLSAKYYLGYSIAAFAGPSLYVRGNDKGVVGPGASLGLAYDWPFDTYSSVELSLRTDVLPKYLETPALVGLRVAYKFSFKKRQGKYRVPEDDDLLR